MSKLAIRGHATRGEEVIQILQMLGGCKSGYERCSKGFYYYINQFGNIEGSTKPYKYEEYIVFTLEEFLEKFPYKVGDKVLINDGEDICTIKSMTWDKKNGRVAYKIGEINGILENNDFWIANEMELYLEKKEETMEETIIDTIKESNDRYRLHINHQYEIEVDKGEYYAVRRKPQYPKTYEECCGILNLTKYPPTLVPNKSMFISQYKDFPHYYEIQKLAELLICRDAYWKLAGEEMGMGKPWEPDWNYETDKYCIYCNNKTISKDIFYQYQFILSFPTEEMRDIFYNNFKDTIETCKNLL